MANNVPAVVTTLKGLWKTNSLETLTWYRSALAQSATTRGGSGFGQTNSCWTWGRYIMTPGTYYLCHNPQAGRRLCQWKIPHHIWTERWPEVPHVYSCTVLHAAAGHFVSNLLNKHAVLTFWYVWHVHGTVFQPRDFKLYYVSIKLSYATYVF